MAATQPAQRRWREVTDVGCRAGRDPLAMPMRAQEGQRQPASPGKREDRAPNLSRFARRVEAELRDLRRMERLRRAGKRLSR
jgi:hypothetical protein